MVVVVGLLLTCERSKKYTWRIGYKTGGEKTTCDVGRKGWEHYYGSQFGVGGLN